MKTFKSSHFLAISIASVAFVLGVWSGCSVGFETDQDEVFPCEDDSDCIQGFECRSDFCRARDVGGNNIACVDDDDDGFGVGETIEERASCPQCANFSKCDPDCNDNDPNVNPGAIDQCNGLDDNCNGEIDEPNECETDRDCGANDGRAVGLQNPPNTRVSCEDDPTTENPNRKTCQVFMSTSICLGENAPDPCPCNSDPVQCVNGEWEEVPDPSLCLN